MKKMRTVTFYLSLFLSTVAFLYAQTDPYTVKLRVGKVVIDCYPSCEHPTEWSTYVYADIFDANNEYVDPSEASWYKWYVDYCDGYEFTYWTQGANLYFTTPDGLKSKQKEDCCSVCTFMSYRIYVVVTINGQDFVSNVIRVPDEDSNQLETKEELIVDQQRESGTSFGLIGLLLDDSFYFYPVPMDIYFRREENQVLKSSQELVYNPIEKYNDWSVTGMMGHAINPNGFAIVYNQPDIISQFKSVHDVTIKGRTSTDTDIQGLIMEFKDPWKIYPDGLWGETNLGSMAPFESLETPYELNVLS